MEKYNTLTQVGHQQLVDELKKLKEIDRPTTLKQMQEARVLGDLRENEAYHAARSKLAMIQGRMEELEQILRHVKILDTPQVSGRVMLGSTVTVAIGDIERTFVLVGEHEADLEKGKISVTSPLGMVLLGAKEAEDVIFTAPSGSVTYKIVKVA